jgi:hypothetical protein
LGAVRRGVVVLLKQAADTLAGPQLEHSYRLLLGWVAPAFLLICLVHMVSEAGAQA